MLAIRAFISATSLSSAVGGEPSLLVAVLHCPVAVLHALPVPQLASVRQELQSLPNSLVGPQKPLWHCALLVHAKLLAVKLHIPVATVHVLPVPHSLFKHSHLLLKHFPFVQSPSAVHSCP